MPQGDAAGNPAHLAAKVTEMAVGIRDTSKAKDRNKGADEECTANNP